MSRYTWSAMNPNYLSAGEAQRFLEESYDVQVGVFDCWHELGFDRRHDFSTWEQLLRNKMFPGQTKTAPKIPEYRERAPKLIGLSLAECLRDIMCEKVQIEDVHCIISNTEFKMEGGILDIFHEFWKSADAVKHCHNFSWYSRALDIFQSLVEEGKFVQPRVLDPNNGGHDVSRGAWIKLNAAYGASQSNFTKNLYEG